MLLKEILLVALGGGVGSTARFLCQRSSNAFFAHAFPFGTFFVNITGCFIIGLLVGLMQKGHLLKPELSLLLVTGFCGGFTTFSSFAAENVQLLKDGRVFYFAVYTVLSVVLGILATVGGLAASRSI